MERRRVVVVSNWEDLKLHNFGDLFKLRWFIVILLYCL